MSMAGETREEPKNEHIQRAAATVRTVYRRVVENPASTLFYCGSGALMVALLLGLSVPWQYYALLALFGTITAISGIDSMESGISK